MNLRSNETTAFEQIKTAVAARPIPTALVTEFDIASVGQVPRIRTNTGFSLRRPVIKIFQ